MARPADTPMPNSMSAPSTLMSSSCSSREAASAAPDASGCSIGAPKMASAASPWNLLTNPPWRLTVSTTTRKNSLSRLTTSEAGTRRGQLRRADQVDEQHRDVAFLTAELGAAFQGATGDVLADVAAEKVTQPLPLGQVANHVVEPGLQQAQFAGVVDLHVRVVVTALHFAQRPTQLAQWISDRHRHQHRAGQTDHQRSDGQYQDRCDSRSADAVRI